MTEEMLKLYNHPYIQSKRGEWQVGDMLYAEGYTVPYTTFCADCQTQESMEDTGAIWLPRTIDDLNPERGLWEMVDWQGVNEHTFNNGPFGGLLEIGIPTKDNRRYITGSPTIVILKAIWGQQGDSK